ncbi:MAG: hypothetical protein RLZZ319_255 [Actinomycetota bacterium]
MNVRALAATAVAASLLLGTAGCGVFVETATLKPYAASDGINVTVGSIDLRDVLIITDETGDGSLIGTVVNNSGTVAHLTVELRGATALTEVIAVEPGVTLLGVAGSTATIFSGAELSAGQYATVYVQYGSADGVETPVPVLDGTDPLYASYTPTLLAPTPEPVVEETPAP